MPSSYEPLVDAADSSGVVAGSCGSGVGFAAARFPASATGAGVAVLPVLRALDSTGAVSLGVTGFGDDVLLDSASTLPLFTFSGVDAAGPVSGRTGGTGLPPPVQTPEAPCSPGPCAPGVVRDRL